MRSRVATFLLLSTIAGAVFSAELRANGPATASWKASGRANRRPFEEKGFI